MAFKPIDPRRDEFRRYLERGGVIEALTKVFVRIVKQRPENPLEYLSHNIGDSLQQADKVAYLETELQDARCEIKRLRDMIQKLDPDALKDPSEETEKVSNKLEEQHENSDEPLGNNENVQGAVVAEVTVHANTDVEQPEFTNKESLENIQPQNGQINNDYDSNPSTPTQSAPENKIE